jgi:hypothetical protein
MMFSILAKAIKLLCILIHSVITLLKSKQLFHFSNHESSWDMVVLESSIEFCPSNFMSSSHHIKASPRSYKAANLALCSSEQGRTNAENLASMALTHASTSRGSSALVKVGGFIPIN